jgi:deoxyribonuclease-4
MHVSITGAIDQAADRAKELTCNTFQMFTRNPRGWKFRKLDSEEVAEFKRKTSAYNLAPAVSHMPYLPNLSSPKKAIYNKSVKSLIAELDRCAMLRIPYVVTHLGSHLGKGADIGLERLVGAVNQAISASKGDVMLLLENTAGTKNSMGSSFEDIRKILDRVKEENRVGLCFDTAHAFAAGYDLRTPEAVAETFRKFDQVLGLRLLKVVHLNDSKGDLGSGRDRHEHIGLGYIGDNGFRALLKHEAIRELPLIMETPIDERRDETGNIRKVRELYA